jgi:hypothetical protein
MLRKGKRPAIKSTFALGHHNVSFGSISGNAQKVQMISGLPRNVLQNYFHDQNEQY